MAVLFLLAAYIGSVRGDLSKEQLRGWIEELLDLPRKADEVLKQAPLCQRLAEHFRKIEDFLFLGRAIHYPIAMDGALKLKEVSYVHAEGYPTGETKHGPNALIDEHLPLVMIATCDRNDPGSVRRHEKDLANIRRRRCRNQSTCERSRFRPASPRVALPHARDYSSTVVRILHRGNQRIGRRQAAKPGEVSNARITTSSWVCGFYRQRSGGAGQHPSWICTSR